MTRQVAPGTWLDASRVCATRTSRPHRCFGIKSFEKVDALLTPTSPTVAFKIGERSEDPLSMYLSDIYTISLNLAGLPGISVPCGFNSDKMPIGLQVIGKPYCEAEILAIAHKFERSHDFYKELPKL